jgi:GDP-4-dehydro-6-deoxy-D-mannose reductase
MKKILITGATGFVGSWLLEYYLQQKNVEVIGTKRRRSNMENVEHLREKVRFVDFELNDGSLVSKVIKEEQPDVVHHLAAQTYVPLSFKAPEETVRTNISGTLYLLEATREHAPDCVFHFAGSSEEYGAVNVFEDEFPITESNLLRPLSPYGASKVAGDLLCQQYFKSYEVKTVITRAFNHTTCRRGVEFVTSNFSKQVAEIEKGKRKKISVGNLEAVRDFTDARDMVRAYGLAVQNCEYGTPYNICSGFGIPIGKVLEILFDLSSLKGNLKSYVEVDGTRLRPSDVPILTCNSSKFREKTGWKPEILFEKTMEDLLNYWREKV